MLGLVTFPENIVQCVNQLHEISNSESVPPNQLPDYIKQKLEQKKEIDEQIQQANASLQSECQ
jgi:hypothetical protein